MRHAMLRRCCARFAAAPCSASAVMRRATRGAAFFRCYARFARMIAALLIIFHFCRYFFFAPLMPLLPCRHHRVRCHAMLFFISFADAYCRCHAFRRRQF